MKVFQKKILNKFYIKLLLDKKGFQFFENLFFMFTIIVSLQQNLMNNDIVNFQNHVLNFKYFLEK